MKNTIRWSLLMTLLSLAGFTSVAVGQPAASKGKNPIDKGDFKVGFPPSEKGKKAMPPELRSAFQEIADGLNSMVALPRDVYLNMDMCGQPNAFYQSAGPQIKICYELIEQFDEEFKTVAKDQKAIEAMSEDTLVQTLFHELGHCLIDQWELPATGREEDAVDQLATVLLLDGSASGQQSALNAALEFAIASSNEAKDDMVFWDEHSFSQTRFYDMLCLVYGSDPQKNGRMVGKDGLPAARASRCQVEYQRASHAWLKLLQPYLNGQ